MNARSIIHEALLRAYESGNAQRAALIENYLSYQRGYCYSRVEARGFTAKRPITNRVLREVWASDERGEQ